MSGHRRRLGPARDRIVVEGPMMGNEAFILLKVGQARPESAKHAEIRLANLARIGCNFASGLAKTDYAHAVVVGAGISTEYG
jgi:hypothetical protein